MTQMCPKCGLPNPQQAAFCHNCAAPLTASAPPPVQPQGGYIAAPQQSQKPMVAMILAIAAFLCCGPLLGIPAAILGWTELSAIKAGTAPESGKTMATIGLWGGVAATVIHIGVYIIYVLFAAMAASNPYAGY